MIGSITRDPGRAVPAILSLLGKINAVEAYRPVIAAVRRRWDEDEKWREVVARLHLSPRMVRHLVMTWALKGFVQGQKKRQEVAERLGFRPPSFILLDPTEACNLRCRGCWAGRYEPHTLPWEVVDRVLTEAKELGIHWVVLSGGEPFAYRYLRQMLARHQDIMFMAYTNGTLISDEVADWLADLGNLTPAISLEGFQEETDARRGAGVYEQIMAAMDRLRERGLVFGASLTVTSRNVYQLFSDRFIDHLIDKGVLYLWSFHYIPIGRDPDLSLMISPEQRAWLRERVNELRMTRPIFIADFWNDGPYVGGCIAGGRHYVHINANGDVEPCAFFHFSTENIKEKSLAEALKSPLFAAFRARQPFHRNLLAPCPIIDHPQMLRDMVREAGARPTHEGADEIMRDEIARALDRRAAEWLALAEELEKTGAAGSAKAAASEVAASASASASASAGRTV
ncbi:MAG: radical SAM protein [Limnochordales bacterium]|nr:radical SAM protein [Limnochordales bacterium]